MNITPLNKTTRMLRTSCIAGTLLLLTVVTLVVVISMIAGLTHAWFTDSVSIDQNKLIVDIPEPGTESAWGGGNPDKYGGDPGIKWGVNPMQYYFSYAKGSEVEEGIIFIGADIEIIGEILVWDSEKDGSNKLYVRFTITDNDYEINTIDLYAGLDAPEGNPASYGNMVTYGPGITEHTYVLSSIDGKDYNDDDDISPGEPVYITAKLDVFK